MKLFSFLRRKPVATQSGLAPARKAVKGHELHVYNRTGNDRHLARNKSRRVARQHRLSIAIANVINKIERREISKADGNDLLKGFNAEMETIINLNSKEGS